MRFTPPYKAVRLKIKGRIAGKMYRASCWAMPEKRVDFRRKCNHKIIYSVLIGSLPPALKKAAIKRQREQGMGYPCVCRCSAEVIKP